MMKKSKERRLIFKKNTVTRLTRFQKNVINGGNGGNGGDATNTAGDEEDQLKENNDCLFWSLF